MKMIEVENLTKRFGDFTAVDHLTFNVKKGEIFGFLGPNGAGKTTTMRMLATLLRPTEGRASVAGFDIVHQANEVRKHIGLVAEKLIHYDQLTAAENLTLFGRLNNLPKEEIEGQIDRWLKRLHMEQWRDHRMGTFSTGMKQRINIARALIHRPEVLFLDEPTLGLDPQTTRAIHEFIEELTKEGMTVLLTTHDMAEAESLCERVAIMDNARIVAMDTTANLKRMLTNGNTGVLDLEVPNLNDAMLWKLKSLNSVSSLAQTNTYGLRIHTSGDDPVPAIVNAISSEGGRISVIRSVEPNLQDVFLHLTGREMRDEANEKTPTTAGHGWLRSKPRIR